MLKIRLLAIALLAMISAAAGRAQEPADTVAAAAPDSILTETLAVPDTLPYPTAAAEYYTAADSLYFAKKDKFPVADFVVPAATFTVAALFVNTPCLVDCREEVQKHLSNHGKNKTSADNYLQYVPAAAPYLLYACGYKGDHNFLDKTILLAMSAATFAILNNSLKFAFNEKRPDSNAHNSFPSGHTGTAFMGAEYMRREYWESNKWVAMSGYVVAATVAYLRIYNDRHWINDVVGGAALGYLSTAFAYWLYPKIFHKREMKHRQELLQKRHQAGEMVLATPFATSYGAGINFSYTF